MNEKQYLKNKTIVIGIGGISRSGKSTLIKKLVDHYKLKSFVCFDDYLIGPVTKMDKIVNSYIEDWEDPKGWDIEKYKETLLKLKEKDNDTNDLNIILVEGFLIYYRKDISSLIDIKIMLDIDKEVARERRKKSKHYGSDYYFDEYIWNGFILTKYIIAN